MAESYRDILRGISLSEEVMFSIDQKCVSTSDAVLQPA